MMPGPVPAVDVKSPPTARAKRKQGAFRIMDGLSKGLIGLCLFLLGLVVSGAIALVAVSNSVKTGDFQAYQQAVEVRFDGLEDELRDAIRDAIASAPDPWAEERAALMAHVHDDRVHETDDVKRGRVRQELDRSIETVTVRIDSLRNEVTASLDRIEKDVSELKRRVDNEQGRKNQ